MKRMTPPSDSGGYLPNSTPSMARPKADSTSSPSEKVGRNSKAVTTGKPDTHIAQASQSGSTNGPLSQDDWEWFKPLNKEV